jgi:uncharacterized protein YkwD
MSCIGILAAFGAAISGCGDDPVAATPPSGPPAFYRKLDSADAKVDALAARDIISVYRRNKGLATVSVDPLLQREAEAQVAAMAKANVASQTVRGSLKSRLDKAHAPHVAAVENVSAGYHTLAEAFSGWRESAPHNANMLNAKVRKIGIATAYAPNSKYHVFWALVLTD